MKYTRLLPLMLTLLLPACVSQPQPVSSNNTAANVPAGLTCNTHLSAEAKTKLNLVDDQESAGHNHAALAELQASSMNSIKHWLRFAQLEAKTGNIEKAAAIFQRLGKDCGSAAAWHGLGLVELKQSKTIAGLFHLEAAARSLPADASAHNDYGYGLLLVGNYKQAIFQLRTALELTDGRGTSRINLATAYLLANDETALHKLVQKYHYSKAEVAYARKMAKQLSLTPMAITSDTSGNKTAQGNTDSTAAR